MVVTDLRNADIPSDPSGVPVRPLTEAHRRAAAPVGGRAATIPILLYHAVTWRSSATDDRFAISPDRFVAHLDHLAETGRRVLPIGALIAARARDDRLASITFDDGYGDTLMTALPRLVERDMSATVYVTTSWIGTTRRSGPMLSPAGLRELAAAGVEIGSHAEHHVALDRLAPGSVRDELRRSRDTLEDIIGDAVTSFAYPHGHHTRHTRAAVVETGFHSACAVRNRTSSPIDDRFSLARITLEDRHDVADLDRMLRRRPAGRLSRARSTLGSIRRGLIAQR